MNAIDVASRLALDIVVVARPSSRRVVWRSCRAFGAVVSYAFICGCCSRSFSMSACIDAFLLSSSAHPFMEPSVWVLSGIKPWTGSRRLDVFGFIHGVSVWEVVGRCSPKSQCCYAFPEYVWLFVRGGKLLSRGIVSILPRRSDGNVILDALGRAGLLGKGNSSVLFWALLGKTDTRSRSKQAFKRITLPLPVKISAIC